MLWNTYTGHALPLQQDITAGGRQVSAVPRGLVRARGAPV